MTLKLNGDLYEIAEGTTLKTFIESLGIRLQGVAIAIDYEIVPKKKWSDTVLTDGMTLLMIHAVSGG